MYSVLVCEQTSTIFPVMRIILTIRWLIMISLFLSFCFAYRETANIPLIALGLKETKEVDFSTLFKVQKQQLQFHHLLLIIAAMHK